MNPTRVQRGALNYLGARPAGHAVMTPTLILSRYVDVS
jgi:hypothetical protein